MRDIYNLIPEIKYKRMVRRIFNMNKMYDFKFMYYAIYIVKYLTGNIWC